MSTIDERLILWLFETKAIRVCPKGNPFWYTSGTIGPYYINTHFLYGSEEKANMLLEIIDKEKKNKFTCPQKILNLVLENYSQDLTYKRVIDTMNEFIKDNINLYEVDYISGGERRDWFFSLIIAHMLKKPHITIFKDLKTVIGNDDKYTEVEDLKGKKVLHIADLITEASSYDRVWIPAVKDKGGEIKWSVVVVDRKQGGEEFLSTKGIKAYSMVDVDENLFKKALAMQLIDEDQYNMIIDYIDNPKGAMKDFLKSNPEFIQNAMKADVKTRERAELCIEKNIYGIR